MFLFNKEEVYIGYSLDEFNEVRGILETENIRYTYRVINHSEELIGRGTIRGHIGSNSISGKYEKLYSVSVNEIDSEKAKYLIRNKSKYRLGF